MRFTWRINLEKDGVVIFPEPKKTGRMTLQVEADGYRSFYESKIYALKDEYLLPKGVDSESVKDVFVDL